MECFSTSERLVSVFDISRIVNSDSHHFLELKLSQPDISLLGHI